MRAGTLLEDQVLASVEARTELARLARLLYAEPQENVETLFLHVWDGLSYVEVATALGVPVGTVRSRMSRLRNRLDTALVSQVGDSQKTREKAKE
jgi:DNA-directed RNA polymerase specialized sigma24 family protein